ncbi:hypothetical protein HU200_006417 [Digitaria exilis]|uniref:Uncharacterized protein n=1 Tax=Digitaria exilis TaxID=1010633 RepID=A0A835KS27_9POAL|nr:hypothetical protein HU200_006417 [Digitaria exilis]
MMHREVLHDPYGPGMHLPPPGHGHGPGPGPFPYDMLRPPPPEVLEQKLTAQRVEMQKLAVENDRLAVSHTSLRKELGGGAAGIAEASGARGGREGCRGAGDEGVARQGWEDGGRAEGLRKLSKDLQRNLGEAQQLPALVAERDAARQEYEHLRGIMNSMVTELEKLRAELRNAASIDKSGVFYNTIGSQKDDGTSSHLSVGQIAYDGSYGRAQARTTPTGLADPLSGSPAGTGLHSGFDPSRGHAYDASRVASFSSSKSATHDVSRVASGFDSLKSAGYDASKAPAIGGHAAATATHGISGGSYGSNQAKPAPYAWVQSSSTYGSVQIPPSYASGSGSLPSSYGSAAVHPYGSAQALPSYGQTQAPTAYGHTQLPSSYGLAQATSAFPSGQGSSPYGLAAQPPAYGSGRAAANAGSNYEAPHGRK